MTIFFFLFVYYLVFLKLNIPVEPSNDFHFFDCNLDEYLSRSEESIPNLKADLNKRIFWFSSSGEKTKVAIVYIHGYSASPQEVRPVPEKVAKKLQANLHFSRLTGHGCDSKEMSKAQIQDWLNDAAEAIAIGHEIGKKTLVISTSTGGTLVSALAVSKGYFNDRDKLSSYHPWFQPLLL